jgi:hypothetical protein
VGGAHYLSSPFLRSERVSTLVCNFAKTVGQSVELRLVLRQVALLLVEPRLCLGDGDKRGSPSTARFHRERSIYLRSVGGELACYRKTAENLYSLRTHGLLRTSKECLNPCIFTELSFGHLPREGLLRALELTLQPLDPNRGERPQHSKHLVRCIHVDYAKRND